jgi:hypothetical protein
MQNWNEGGIRFKGVLEYKWLVIEKSGSQDKNLRAQPCFINCRVPLNAEFPSCCEQKHDSNWHQVSRLVFSNEPELEYSISTLECEKNDEISPFQNFSGTP